MSLISIKAAPVIERLRFLTGEIPLWAGGRRSKMPVDIGRSDDRGWNGVKDVFDMLRQRRAHVYDGILIGRYAGWPSYALAIASSGAAFWLRELLGGLTGARLSFALVVPAIFISSLLGGL
ncbi:MAG TPA: hypothetical protein VN042_04345, partial [Asticcacaulis sp.]|nr:hypothetical protein [Asticcacaulis sp.]